MLWFRKRGCSSQEEGIVASWSAHPPCMLCPPPGTLWHLSTARSTHFKASHRLSSERLTLTYSPTHYSPTIPPPTHYTLTIHPPNIHARSHRSQVVCEAIVEGRQVGSRLRPAAARQVVPGEAQLLGGQVPEGHVAQLLGGCTVRGKGRRRGRKARGSRLNVWHVRVRNEQPGSDRTVQNLLLCQQKKCGCCMEQREPWEQQQAEACLMAQQSNSAMQQGQHRQRPQQRARGMQSHVGRQQWRSTAADGSSAAASMSRWHGGGGGGAHLAPRPAPQRP